MGLRYRIWYVKAYLKYTVFKIYINIIKRNRSLNIFTPPPPSRFQVFQSICATPNFKSWMRPWWLWKVEQAGNNRGLATLSLSPEHCVFTVCSPIPMGSWWNDTVIMTWKRRRGVVLAS